MDEKAASVDHRAKVISALTLLELMIFMAARKNPDDFADRLHMVLTKELSDFRDAVREELLQSQKATNDALASALGMRGQK